MAKMIVKIRLTVANSSYPDSLINRENTGNSVTANGSTQPDFRQEALGLSRFSQSISILRSDKNSEFV